MKLFLRYFMLVVLGLMMTFTFIQGYFGEQTNTSPTVAPNPNSELAGGNRKAITQGI